MSKRIKQSVENGSVRTRTSGSPRGDMPNFDVDVFSPATASKKGAVMTLKLEGRKPITLNGRQLKTVRELLDLHFETFEDLN